MSPHTPWVQGSLCASPALPPHHPGAGTGAGAGAVRLTTTARCCSLPACWRGRRGPEPRVHGAPAPARRRAWLRPREPRQSARASGRPGIYGAAEPPARPLHPRVFPDARGGSEMRTAAGGRGERRAGGRAGTATGLQPVAGARRRGCGAQRTLTGPWSAASGAPFAVPVPGTRCSVPGSRHSVRCTRCRYRCWLSAVRAQYPMPVAGTGSSPGSRHGWTRLGAAGAQRSAPGSIFQPLPSYRGGAEGPRGPVPPRGASPRPRPNNGERRSCGISYGAAGAAAPGLSVTARISPAGGCAPAPCPELPAAAPRLPRGPAHTFCRHRHRHRRGGARHGPRQLPAQGGAGPGITWDGPGRLRAHGGSGEGE